MKLASIVGARPQFIKLAPLARALEAGRDRGGGRIEHVIIHTGQHYDAPLSDVFFDELGIPRPAVHLDAGSGSHGAQTARILERTETALQEMRPDMVIVYGDTNSTLGAALAAAKLGIRLAHVEAGLRSFNRSMAEEVNRIVADHVADLLLAPTAAAAENLAREGLSSRTIVTGDLMLDAVQATLKAVETRSRILETLGLERRAYALATVHRAENTDDPGLLEGILEALDRIAAAGLPVVFPVHPRTVRAIAQALPGWTPGPSLRLIEPVGHIDMLCLLRHARLALTDSGGLQKEAFFVGCPCITLRDETEWTETVEAGANIVSGPGAEAVCRAAAAWEARLDGAGSSPEELAADFARKAAERFGGGRAAGRIAACLIAACDEGSEDRPIRRK